MKATTVIYFVVILFFVVVIGGAAVESMFKGNPPPKGSSYNFRSVHRIEIDGHRFIWVHDGGASGSGGLAHHPDCCKD